ncbi:aldolase [Paenibacillus nasutitermitis]|uniref:HPr kinase n=1 Tax=Paenibacillus nasutitermitis TaxID=1652958 RepID=A0A917DXH7_9BACL|nr:aldolase [Paenibacillus nasutitermitis]GGD76088.1 HPr kinase [Paenibacillus nasutitermitis]
MNFNNLAHKDKGELMIATEKRTIYKAFGLNITSEIPLPELPSISGQAPPEVKIVRGDLSKEWEQAGPHQTYYAAGHKQVLFNMPRTAIFAVQDGKRIIISPFAGAAESMIRLYLLGTCMGALLLQRNILPLHGSAVVIEGKAYAFIGESGAGKSTLAAAFVNEGYELLSDDVIAVSYSKETGTITVIPSYPQQKLWQNSIENLGMKKNKYVPLHYDAAKFAIPVSGRYCADAVQLAGVFELLPSDCEHSEINPLLNLERFPVLSLHTYRNFLVPLLGLVPWHFSVSSSIIRQARIFRLHRPASATAGFSAQDLVSQIINIIK